MPQNETTDQLDTIAGSDYQLWLLAPDDTLVVIGLTPDQALAISHHVDGGLPIQGGEHLDQFRITLQAFMQP